MNRLFSHKMLCLGSLAVATMFALAPVSHAGVIVTDPGSGTLRTNFTGTVGYVFTVGTSDVSVTDLGLYDAANGGAGTVGDGLVDSAEVAIFLVSDQSEVVSGTVATGTGGTLLDGFRYVHLGSSVTLTAGETYFIGMGVSGNGNAFHDQSNTPVLNTTDFSGFGARFSLSGSSTDARYFADDRAGAAYVGPNFQYVPEPASLALLGVGGLLIGCRRH